MLPTLTAPEGKLNHQKRAASTVEDPPSADESLSFGKDNLISQPAHEGHSPINVASHTDSAMFKSTMSYQSPRAKRWDHRITLESSSRHGSALKRVASLLTTPNIITLATGRPTTKYFPWKGLNINVLEPPQFSEEGALQDAKTFAPVPDQHSESLYDFSASLDYERAAGSVQLLRFITEHIEIVYNPPYADWDSCLTSGSTSALEMAYRIFCSRGQYILAEEYTFSGAIEAALPLGIKVEGLKMDSEGLIPSYLDSILSNWHASRGPQPFLLYTIPTGQNPTGTTQSLARRKEIYGIAEKHDLFIVEDDPYYFLQMEPYITNPSDQRGTALLTVSDFRSTLIPSYLSIDTSGRVLRLDSSSKILAPGLRCGWMTACSQVIDRFLNHHEVSTVSPSGPSQIMMYRLLEEIWGNEGFFKWLMYLRSEYTKRRNTILRACEEFLPSAVCSWVAPTAGMSCWIKVRWNQHPLVAGCKEEVALKKLRDVEDKIFLRAVQRGVLFCKGQ
jgi:aromatic amino acid aminotransferase I